MSRTIELVWDLESRIQAALDSGKTGDLEVIAHLASNDLVETWTRKDPNGHIRKMTNSSMTCAIACNFEVRPKPDKEEPQS